MTLHPDEVCFDCGMRAACDHDCPNHSDNDDINAAARRKIYAHANRIGELSPALDKALGDFVADKPPSIMKE